MTDSLITIIIPVYNCGKYLERCITSVVGQSYHKLEIMLIDDGSTDSSSEICERFSSKDARIKYIRQSNKGVSAARNMGINHSTGEFISFLDADDMLQPNAIEWMLAAVHENTDLVIASYESFRGVNVKKSINRKCEFSKEDIRNQFAELDKMIDFPWGKLFRRSIISDNKLAFDENLSYGEDHIFNITFCRYAKGITVIEDVVYRYRLGGIASSVKYHANMHQLNYAIIKAYEDVKVEIGLIPIKYLQEKIRDQLFGTILHYISNCAYAELMNRVKETLTLFSPYLNEIYITAELYTSDMRASILKGDSERIVSYFIKHNWKRIILKKTKLFCYRWFKCVM